MAKSLMICGNSSPQEYVRVGAGAESIYFVCANAPLVIKTVRANTQITYHTPGVISKAGIYADMTNLAVDATATLEINGESTAISVTLTAGLVQRFSDNVNTATVADGDEVNWKVTLGSGDDPGFSCYISHASIVFEPTDSTLTMVKHAAINFAAITTTTARYAALSDNCSTLNTTEVWARFDCNAAGTLKNMFVKCSAFSGFTNLECALMLDGAQAGSPGNLEANATSTTIAEDTTNAVTVAANDDVCYRITATGAGSATVEIVAVEWVSTNKQFHSIFAGTGGGFIQAKSTTKTTPGGGGATTLANDETAHRVPMGFSAIVSNLTGYVSANTLNTPPPASGSGFDIILRGNGTDTPVALNWAEGVTGQSEDTSDSESYTSTRELSLKCVANAASTGSVTWRHVGMLITNTEAGATAVKDVIGCGVIPFAR